MGFGMVAGGIAKGIVGQQDLAQKQKALALQTAELQNNNAYRNASLGLEQQRLKATTGIEQSSQARQLYANGLETIKATIAASLKNGNNPQQIKDAIAGPLGYLMNVVGPAAGIPGQVTDQTVSAMIATGSPTPSPSDHLGEIIANFRAGKPLSKQDKALLDNYQKAQNPYAGMLKDAVGGPDTSFSSMVPDLGGAPGGAPAVPAPAPEAPAAAPAPAPAPAAPASMAPAVTEPAAPKAPPIPKKLVGKSPRWSPNDPKFFFLPDGTITDLQGNTLGKINGGK